MQEVLGSAVYVLKQFGGDEATDVTVTAIQAVLSSDTETAKLESRLREFEIVLEDEDKEFTEDMCEEMDQITQDLKHRPQASTAHSILFGLGFTEEQKNRPCNALSGGWLQRHWHWPRHCLHSRH